MNKNLFCNICKNIKIEPYLDLGLQPRANNFHKTSETISEDTFNLIIGRCKKCGLSQLLFYPKKENVFHNNYMYFTGVNNPMVDHFNSFSKEVRDNFVHEEDLIVEVGSNDGTFLKNFTDYRCIGIEPCKSVADQAIKNGVHTIVNFFDNVLVKDIILKNGKAKFIFAANVIGHIDEINKFVKNIKELLHKDGTFVFEIYYLPKLILKRRYDLIYDEHIYYFTVYTLKILFQKYSLSLFKIDEIHVHGGSIRGYVSHKEKKIFNSNIDKFIYFEKNVFNLFSSKTYSDFNSDVILIKKSLIELIKKISKLNKVICGFGATAKSTTILNYIGKESKYIKCIYDNTPIKQNNYSPGSKIPIVDESKFLSDFPDYTILFAWNYEKEIRKKYLEYENKGGKWIAIHPKVKIMD